MPKSLIVKEFSLPHSRLKPANILENCREVKRQEAGIFHITGDAHYVALALPKNKTVLTVHDCVFLEDTKGVKRLILKFLFLTLPVKHACCITTISQKTKDEIVHHTGCSPNKITVVYNPVSSSIYYKPQPFNQTKPVILFLGTKENKNLHNSIKALKNIDCHLDIVGKLSGLDLKLLKENNVSFAQSVNVSEQEIADKYAGCDLVLFPSIYEGFGLPIIEGNKAGRVVITSNIAPMNEVASDAACLVDPYDIGSIKKGVLKVINEPDYREQLIQNGFDNIDRFKPDVIAAQYLNVYKSML